MAQESLQEYETRVVAEVEETVKEAVAIIELVHKSGGGDALTEAAGALAAFAAAMLPAFSRTALPKAHTTLRQAYFVLDAATDDLCNDQAVWGAWRLLKTAEEDLRLIVEEITKKVEEEVPGHA